MSWRDAKERKRQRENCELKMWLIRQDTKVEPSKVSRLGCGGHWNGPQARLALRGAAVVGKKDSAEAFDEV